MDKPQVYVFNSLTRQKVPLVPNNAGTILWYNCGPTVYDSAHMGHARSYISLDIIRRILVHVFGYTVKYVMNITDIDDKIIRKARQEYLFRKYLEKTLKSQGKSLKSDLEKAVKFYNEKLSNENDSDKKAMMSRLLNLCITAMGDSLIGVGTEVLISKSKDVLVEYLDHLEGKEVDDNSIFFSLPEKYEKEFFDDMWSLNVMNPDELTHVSEYVPQIVTFILNIISNGYAYESNNSVYFDTVKFGSCDKHRYGKLVPEAIGDAKALNEGEGVLTGDDTAKEKKNPNDFALWKRSKPGEPSWESPWGRGRPGWHIECSVMASDTLGEVIDIHSGGIDLKFPHHENEIAQTEAFYDTGRDWIKYWLHTGHLTISGCKMSKSLKNFITIKDALNQYTSNQLRLAFLLHSWNDTLDYSQNTMREAIGYQKTLSEFLARVGDCMRKSDFTFKASKIDRELNKRFEATKTQVLKFLADNFDTKSAMRSISSLVKESHKYIQENDPLNIIILRNIVSYIGDLFRSLGVVDEQDSVNKEEAIMPFLEILAEFRLKMRQIGTKETTEACDVVRDKLLDLGVKVEDEEKAGKMTFAIKVLNKEALDIELEERESKRNKKLEKERKKQEQLAVLEAKDILKKVPPSQLFIHETDKYSKFDEKGLPTHDAEGKPITKSQMKKLQKLYDQQEKKFNEYIKRQNGETTENIADLRES